MGGPEEFKGCLNLVHLAIGPIRCRNILIDPIEHVLRCAAFPLGAFGKPILDFRLMLLAVPSIPLGSVGGIVVALVGILEHPIPVTATDGFRTAKDLQVGLHGTIGHARPCIRQVEERSPDDMSSGVAWMSPGAVGANRCVWVLFSRFGLS
ncbi:hypothetical protein J2S71_000935 [Olsenella profusa DSM 13989]|nr:hypothetical protein [Olsenella profusa DSM 13989]